MENDKRNIAIDELKHTISLYEDITGNTVNYQMYLFIAITHHSTKIEGSSYNYLETQTLIEKNITAQKDYTSAGMIKDHFNALNFVVDQSGKKIIPDIKIIKAVAGMVKKSTGTIHNNIIGVCDETQGDFRVHSVTVGSKNVHFPEPGKINSLMNKLLSEIKEKIMSAHTLEDKLYIAFKLHYDLVMIHPFSDGNGRTARLMMNYMLNFYNLPLFTVSSSLQEKYIKALEETFQTNNFNHFYNFSKYAYNEFLKDQIATIVKL